MGKEFLDDDDEEASILAGGGSISINEEEEEDEKEVVLFSGEVSDDEDNISEETLLNLERNGKGKNAIGPLKITVDEGSTARNFSENNAYIKVYSGSDTSGRDKNVKVIRLHLCNPDYEFHNGSGTNWKDINNKDFNRIKKALSMKCNTGDYKNKDMTVYDAAFDYYSKRQIFLKKPDSIPDYSTQNSHEVHGKN